jgi:hypothetical protein
MYDDLLDKYLDRDVVVFFTPAMVSPATPAYEEGRLHTYSSSGILLEQGNGNMLFIPAGAIRMIEIKPKPSFWDRLTGS